MDEQNEQQPLAPVGQQDAQKPADAQIEVVEAPKKKRGRPKKQTTLVQPSTGVEQPQAVGQPQQIAPEPSVGDQKPLVQTAKRGKPRRKKLKLTTFDKDVFKLLRRGVKSAGELSAMLGVDSGEVGARMQELAKSSMVVIEGEQASLSVGGYNAFLPDSLETTFEEKARKRREAEQRKQKLAEKPKAQPLAAPVAQVPQPAAPVGGEPQGRPGAHTSEIIEIAGKPEGERVDLAEMIARGAPKPDDFFARKGEYRASRRQQVNTPAREAAAPAQARAAGQAAPRQEASEKCILCKEPFVIAVNGGNPKYGHCFCGAAYHQDCYEGVLQNNSECIQCGKKLDIILDKASLDEVKKIKDVFG